MPSPLSHINNVFIRVNDLEKSIDWYTNVLGFKSNWRNDDGGYAYMDFEGFPLMLVKSKFEEELKPMEFSLLNFNTTNIEESLNFFKEQNVETGEIEAVENSKWFWFKDPDGNIFQISQF